VPHLLHLAAGLGEQLLAADYHALTSGCTQTNGIARSAAS